MGNLSLLQGSSQPRDQTQVSCTAGRFFTSWATRKAQKYWRWVAYPVPIGSSWLRNWTGVSSIAGRFFANWAIMGLNKCLITCFNQDGIVQSIFTILKIFTVLPANSPHPPQLLATTDFFYCLSSCCCSVVRPQGLQHARPPCPSPSPRACSNSCPMSQWCHPTILSSVVPFSFCLQSFPASGSLPMSWLFASGGQSIEALASPSLLPTYIQGWFPLGLIGWIFLVFKGLSRVSSSTTIWRHPLFRAQSSLLSSSHIHTRLLENHSFNYMDLCRQSNVSAF